MSAAATDGSPSHPVRPAPHDRGPADPEGEALLGGEAPDLVCPRPHGGDVALELS